MAVLLCFAATSAAAPLPVLLFEDCETAPLEERAFRSAWAIELAGSSADEVRPLEVRVRYYCDHSVSVQVTWPETVNEHVISISDVPAQQRVRTLALAVAELTRSPPREPAAPSGVDGRNAASSPEAGSAAASSGDFASTGPATTSHAAQAEASGVDGAHRPNSGQPNKVEQPPGAIARTETKGQNEQAKRDRSGGRAESGPVRSSTMPAGARTESEAITSHLEAGPWSLSAGFRVVVDSPELLFGGSAAYRWGPWWFGLHGFLGRHEPFAEDVSLGSVTGGLAAARVGRVLVQWEPDPLRVELHAAAAVGITWAEGSTSTDLANQTNVRPFIEARGSMVVRLVQWREIAPFLEVYGGRSSGIAAEAVGQTALVTGGWIFGTEAGVSF